MIIERTFDAANRAIGKWSRISITCMTLLGVMLVGVPDYLIGADISLSIFYLGPVGIAAWYAGSKRGALVALVSTAVALAAEFGAEHHLVRIGIMAWNGFLHLGFMLVVIYLLNQLRVHTENERKLARSDPLTGIFNRRAFMEHLRYGLQIEGREGKPITLAYIDLDDFKRINDEHGHEEGDRVLRRVADTLTASIRQADVVARLGGDEFALLLAGAGRDDAEKLAAKVRNALQQAFINGRSTVTCSIGCATFQGLLPDADGAIKAADSLMYKVKRQGKDAVAFEVLGNLSDRGALRATRDESR